MKVSDFIISTLRDKYGVTDIFLVSGGGIMHLLESVGSADGIRYFCTYHEQAAVVAAEGYARRSGRLGVALVTVGPGAANAVSALPGAWVDSIPLLVLAGQVRSDMIADYSVSRQRGPQEANTLDMARPVVKYASRLLDPSQVLVELDKAVESALTGRPGPAWLELPVDITALSVDPSALAEWKTPAAPYNDESYLAREADRVALLLRDSKRPLIVPGNGIRSSGAYPAFLEFLRTSGLPVAIPFTAKDLVPEDHGNYVGVFGTAGQRRANFAIQNADLMLGLASGLNVQKMGFNVADFARKAKKVLVDIDRAQLSAQPLATDMPIQADVARFLPALIAAVKRHGVTPNPEWTAACSRWKERYPLITSDYRQDPAHINSYLFMDALAEEMREGDTLVTGAGLDVVSTYQAFRVKKNQRVLISGWGSMGWDLPLSIGAMVSSGARVVTVTGDGSVQWNVQELLTIQRYALPLKLFVFNNEGFSSIRATQRSFFDAHFVGSDHSSGVATADFERLAETFGLTYTRLSDPTNLQHIISTFLADDAPAICEVFLAPEQSVSPKASAFRRDDGTFESRPLEDMSPFLPREEIVENMTLFDQPAC